MPRHRSTLAPSPDDVPRARRARRPAPTAGFALKALMAAHSQRFAPTDDAPGLPGALTRHIARHWTEIVGPRLASLSQAERLSGRGRDGVLHVAAVGPAAVLIEADSARVLERVNTSCGRVVAGRLAIRPLATPQSARANESADRGGVAAPPLRAARKLERALEPVRDPELKSALRELGRATLASKAEGR